MHFFLIIGLYLFQYSAIAHAEYSECGSLSSAIESKEITCLVNELVRNSFPELAKALASGRIRFREFESDAYFLQASFLKGQFSSSKNREYSIDINPKIFDPQLIPNGPPSLEAIQGILAHELVHVLDYETESFSNLTEIGLELILSPSHYERYTDLRAFELGYAYGIKSYRNWIYGQLSPTDLAQKRKRYYTPEEIDHWLLTRKPSDLLK